MEGLSIIGFRKDGVGVFIGARAKTLLFFRFRFSSRSMLLIFRGSGGEAGFSFSGIFGTSSLKEFISLICFSSERFHSSVTSVSEDTVVLDFTVAFEMGGGVEMVGKVLLVFEAVIGVAGDPDFLFSVAKELDDETLCIELVEPGVVVFEPGDFS